MAKEKEKLKLTSSRFLNSKIIACLFFLFSGMPHGKMLL
jgi:hypothetical protein